MTRATELVTTWVMPAPHDVRTANLADRDAGRIAVRNRAVRTTSRAFGWLLAATPLLLVVTTSLRELPAGLKCAAIVAGIGLGLLVRRASVAGLRSASHARANDA